MASFRNRVLTVIDTVYGLVGGQRGSHEIDLVSPIVRVHDTAREAELGSINFTEGASSSSGISGFFTIVDTFTTVGTATLAKSLGVYSNQSTTWAAAAWSPPDPDKETIWVVGASGLVPAASTLVGLDIMIDMRPKAGAGAGLTPNMLYMRMNNIGLSDGVSRQAILASGAGSMHARPVTPFPVPLLQKQANANPINVLVATGATASVELNVFCLRLPIGVFPPGWR